jgi:hypothetical protein
MDVRFQKFVDRWAGIPVCAALSLWHFGAQLMKGRFPAPPPRRILVILLSEMGSLVLAEPMFRRWSTWPTHPFASPDQPTPLRL